MLSSDIKEQDDYQVMMTLIDNVLNTQGANGSIAFGKQYATKYKNILGDLLREDEVNLHVLLALRMMVDADLQVVRADCRRRVETPFTVANNEMMSMITDFVKSL